jgi:hypothetical protein
LTYSTVGSFHGISSTHFSSRWTTNTSTISSLINSKDIQPIVNPTLYPGIILMIQTGEETSTPYDIALEVSPNNTVLLFNAGKYLAEKKEMYTPAISLFDKAIKIDSNCYQAIYLKAQTFTILGRHDEAKTLFDIAFKLHPEYKGESIVKPHKKSYALSGSSIERTL